MTRPSEITRDRILKAAERLFAERGYEDTSVRAIVAKARVNQAAINYHFAGKDGLQIKNEILDKEYKGAVKLAVNGRYPDDVPISTVPPQVLAQLPKLPEELEYRFIRTNLILFDPHAHIIADFVERAFE